MRDVKQDSAGRRVTRGGSLSPVENHRASDKEQSVRREARPKGFVGVGATTEEMDQGPSAAQWWGGHHHGEIACWPGASRERWECRERQGKQMRFQVLSRETRLRPFRWGKHTVDTNQNQHDSSRSLSGSQ